MDDALATDSETGNSTEYQLPTQFQSCNNHTRLLRPYALAVSLSVLLLLTSKIALAFPLRKLVQQN